MRMSKMHFHTLREVPAEAEIPSHILMLRANMIRKLVSGVYGFMPLGTRVLHKVEQIVREEMDAKGAQEILTSATQPAELWQESGRWWQYGPELWRLKDRNGRDFCLGPTHEEVFTDIVRSEVESYKQLPIQLYQIQTKYRDEARPRFGLMRSREFIMKDNYSFDVDREGLDKAYDGMYEAYTNVFTRVGLNFRPVEADTGAIGGKGSHEFTALAEVGESSIAYCDACGLAATDEQAECVDAPAENDEMLALEEVNTPGTTTIESVAEYLGIGTDRTIKALLFVKYDDEGNEDGYVAVFIRGDRELNIIKLVNALDIPEHAIEFANEAKMGEVTGSVAGFTGPMGLHDCTMVVDSELVGMKNLVAGACKKDYHVKNVNYGRDYEGDIVTDLKMVQEGYACPECGAPLKMARGIEVGQIFKLGTKYSEAMGAVYKDEKGEEHPIVMGCYGIGVTRTMAAIVEQHHDENGIIWPMSVAPYHVIITLIKPDDEHQAELAEAIYEELTVAGVEVLLDDRDERPGVKFKDADLIGIPVRVTVGRDAEEAMVEFKERSAEEAEKIPATEAVDRIKDMVTEQKDGRNFFE